MPCCIASTAATHACGEENTAKNASSAYRSRNRLRGQRRSHQRVMPGQHLRVEVFPQPPEMHPDDVRGRDGSQGAGDPGAPVAAVCSVTLVTEFLHQNGPGASDPVNVPALRLGGAGEAEAGKRTGGRVTRPPSVVDRAELTRILKLNGHQSRL